MDFSKYCLPKDFPSNLLETSVPLDVIGINQLAWKFNDALAVVEFLGDHNYAILGGDIYKAKDDEISITNDKMIIGMLIKKNSATSWEQYCLDCKNKALSYIKQHRDTKGEGFYYAVTL